MEFKLFYLQIVPAQTIMRNENVCSFKGEKKKGNTQKDIACWAHLMKKTSEGTITSLHA